LKFPRSNSGFTLLELLVATAVSSLILVMVYSAYSSIIRSVDQANVYSAHYESVILTLRQIDNDISNIYWKKSRKDLFFKSSIEGGSSRFSFITARSRDKKVVVSQHRQSPYPDLVRVEYRLEEDNKTKEVNLLRNVYLFTIKEEELPVKNEILIRGIKDIKFLFNQRSDWTDKWDSVEVNKIPSYVKTEINIKSPEHGLDEYSFISEIHLQND